jgi:hypothetical protein
MGNLKPIGSEKLEGLDKIARIMEIANYGKSSSEINESNKTEYNRVLSDGNVYSIVKEKLGYIVKKGINESNLDYIEPMKNRKYHSSYSQALKKLNLIAGELNRLNENEVGTELFGEQKKVLKMPKPPTPPPAPEPMPEPLPAPDMGGEEMSIDTETPDMGGEEMSVDTETPDMGGEEMDVETDVEVDDDEMPTFKSIQKLTGKLGQKLRTFSEVEEMTSENIKYVINSILSALDLTKLDETDTEDIMSKFEGGEEESGDYDMDVAIASSDDEPSTDMGELDLDVDAEVSPEVGEGMNYPNRIIDDIFSESKVDKILSKYFVITEEEKTKIEESKVDKFIKQKINKADVLGKIKQLSETIEQELTSEFVLKENPEYKFVGRTNLNNLVFEHMGKQIKVSPRGEII